MQHRFMWLVLLGTAMVVTAGTARATPPEGFTSTTLAAGPFAAFDVNSHFVSGKGKVWVSLQKTTGKSDGYVLNNTWDPGGSTGWHTHPAYSLIFVTAGAITHYDGNDPSCTPHVYTAGMTFVDRGGSHVHIVRNEGDVEAQAVVVRLVPAGQAGRIDAADPGNCPF